MTSSKHFVMLSFLKGYVTIFDKIPYTIVNISIDPRVINKKLYKNGEIPSEED